MPPRRSCSVTPRFDGHHLSKKRGLLVWGLFAVATILLFVSSLTVWAKRQLLDDQAWANSSTQLLANDDVRGAIAQKLSDGLFQRVDVEAQLRERLPPRAQAAAAPLAAALQNNVGPAAANRLLQRPRVQTLWQNANKRAHAAVLRVLEGKDLGPNGNISTANGEVTLDLRPAITQAGDAAWCRGQAEGERRSDRRPNRAHEVGPARGRADRGEDPQSAELAAPDRSLRPLRTCDLPRAGAATVAAGRDRGESRVRWSTDRLPQALRGRRWSSTRSSRRRRTSIPSA